MNTLSTSELSNLTGQHVRIQHHKTNNGLYWVMWTMFDLLNHCFIKNINIFGEEANETTTVDSRYSGPLKSLLYEEEIQNFWSNLPLSPLYTYLLFKIYEPLSSVQRHL